VNVYPTDQEKKLYSQKWGSIHGQRTVSKPIRAKERNGLSSANQISA